jgi:hypothetical protein
VHAAEPDAAESMSSVVLRAVKPEEVPAPKKKGPETIPEEGGGVSCTRTSPPRVADGAARACAAQNINF